MIVKKNNEDSWLGVPEVVFMQAAVELEAVENSPTWRGAKGWAALVVDVVERIKEMFSCCLSPIAL